GHRLARKNEREKVQSTHKRDEKLLFAVPPGPAEQYPKLQFSPPTTSTRTHNKW
ncbi:Hypothetical predicted protein, partial [Olea europaea subsp. europaea]